MGEVRIIWLFCKEKREKDNTLLGFRRVNKEEISEKLSE